MTRSVGRMSRLTWVKNKDLLIIMSSLRLQGTAFELALVVKSLGSQPFRVLPDTVSFDSGQRSGLVLEPLGEIKLGKDNFPTEEQVIDVLDRIPSCWSHLGDLNLVLGVDSMMSLAGVREVKFDGKHWVLDRSKVASAVPMARIDSFLCLLPVHVEAPV